MMNISRSCLEINYILQQKVTVYLCPKLRTCITLIMSALIGLG